MFIFSQRYSTIINLYLRFVVSTLVGFFLLVHSSFSKEMIRGGILTAVPFYSDQHQYNFNPYELRSGAHYARDFIYEPLWIFNPLNPESNFPRLATHYYWSENYQELTFKLRQKVKFSDGEPFDADDVVFTANMLKAHPELSQSIDWFDELTQTGNLLDVIKVNDLEVKFLFAKPDHLAHQRIGKMYILPEHIWKKMVHPHQFSNRKPVGTGPFTEVKNFNKNKFQLCRNTYYWEEGKPYIDCMQFPQIKNHEQAVTQAASGKIDWMNAVIADIDRNFVQKNQNNKFWFFPTGQTSIVLDTNTHPFDILEFRQAMSMAIDRDYLLKVSQLSISSSNVNQQSLGVFSNDKDNANLGKFDYLFQYNQKQAAQLLTQSGFIDSNGDGFRENPDGTRLAFYISISSERTDLVNVLIAVVEDLQDIGLNVRIQSATQTQWIESVALGKYPAYIQGFDEDIVDLSSIEHYVKTQQNSTKPISLVVVQNSLQPLYDLIEQYHGIKTPSEQSKILSKIQSLVSEQLPTINLFSNAKSYQYNDFYFEGWANQANPFIRPSVQMGYPERAIHVLNLSLKTRPRYRIER
ncbi:ABC transporter substrate-binding protein [Marinicellulosiphila megalodicopiae]|uniref:ABC transporter substrate-binding protein n=1 Tax=Marinicellulosiphila megalodicopiae TaxID=2724896 RepID=UPI003BB1E972